MFAASKTKGVSAVAANYIEDVFSTWLYTGNGSTQTITNGIDLAGKGGLVWNQCRSNAYGGYIYDTDRGINNRLHPFASNAQYTATQDVTAFNSTGFTMGSDAGINGGSGQIYTSWTFRKQPKFFDVVTWTGDGNASQTIFHGLGSAPGFITCKSTSATGDWWSYHRATSATPNQDYGVLNSSNAWTITASNFWAVTSTTFTANSALNLNTSGVTYVAYVFAHNAGGFGLTGTDNVISCGSYVGNGSATGPTVTLGYEPQWLMIKDASNSTPWMMFDSMRGLTAPSATEPYLMANAPTAEQVGLADYITPTATGFNSVGNNSYVNASGETYIYIAIRRGPMKVPTDGTKVFKPATRTGTGSTGSVASIGFTPDMVMADDRTGSFFNSVYDRLRGGTRYLLTQDTGAEGPNAGVSGFDIMNSFYVGVGNLGNASGVPFVDWNFQRAPGFFDEVCYTSDGTYNPINHNLTVVPELVIQKIRDGAGNWYVYNGTQYGYLNTTAAFANFSRTLTATTFVPITQSAGNTFVTYLFASCPGVSKIGSYTGTGATQTINCGFIGGARFVLIKRTDSTGDWYVWDTARGMVSGTDPSLLLNSNAAEVNANSVYTTTGGFQIVSTAAGINASGGSYIFLAIA